MAKLILALIVALSPAVAVAQSTTGTAGPGGGRCARRAEHRHLRPARPDDRGA